MHPALLCTSLTVHPHLTDHPTLPVTLLLTNPPYNASCLIVHQPYCSPHLTVHPTLLVTLLLTNPPYCASCLIVHQPYCSPPLTVHPTLPVTLLLTTSRYWSPYLLLTPSYVTSYLIAHKPLHSIPHYCSPPFCCPSLLIAHQNLALLPLELSKQLFVTKAFFCLFESPGRSYQSMLEGQWQRKTSQPGSYHLSSY